MATSRGQRIGIWIIVGALTMGTLAGFVVMVIAPQNEQKDAQQSQAELDKYMEEYRKQQAAERVKKRALDGYAAEAFDAASVKDLKVEVLKEGSGETLTKDSKISANYFGWQSDGTIFDSSNNEGTTTPIEFSLSSVIAGWTEGLTGQKVGSTVKLTIPSNKAYGDTDTTGMGQPTGPLQFIVEIKSIVKEDSKE
ncbi:MAG: FKBP-type peptidyl-prolyl cis-trans isomerase [Candidatus Saccharimonadales bacterium]